MSDRPKLLGISGSLRTGANSTAVLEGLRVALEPRADLTVLRLNDVPMYNQDLDTAEPPVGVAALRAAVKAADGIVLVSPEYNYGIPGVVKNAIDWISRPGGNGAVKGKPVLIVTSSPGTTGGVRAQGEIRGALTAALARPITYAHVAIAGVNKKVEDGKLTDKDALDFTIAAVDALMAEIRMLAVVKNG